MRNTRSRHLPAFFVLLALLVLAGCERDPAAVQLAGDTMGTRYHVTLLPPPGLDKAALHAELEAILAAVNDSMSTYIPDSEISRFNNLNPGEEIAVSGYFIEVFRISESVAAQSGGAYDVSVAPLVDLWGFGPGAANEIPPGPAIAAALARVGQDAVAVDAARGTLAKQRPVSLDFSSVAKGYAVDLLADALERRGIANYMVEIGGELRVSGFSPRGDSWRIAVENPSPAGGVAATLALSDIAVATSGDYRNYFEVDGVRYSHTIDPRTGWPVRHALVSVTVLHDSAAVADAWATALAVLGPGEALDTARARGLAVYLVYRDGRVEKTAEIAAFLR